MSHDDTLKSHYSRATIRADVEASLRALGKDPDRITIDDLDLIDEFHLGGRPATRALFAAAAFPKGARILDVGSGFGGPARVGASEYGLVIDGIDLTPAFVEVADDLSRRTGQSASTRFTVGSALDLPFDPATFDGAYMIHVGMNIADKKALMAAVHRTLKAGSVFMIYDIMRIADGDIAYPMPWSSVAATSALATPAAYRAALEAAGFAMVSELDRRQLARQGVPTEAPPTLPHRGAGWEIKVANLAAAVKGGILAPIEMIARA